MDEYSKFLDQVERAVDQAFYAGASREEIDAAVERGIEYAERLRSRLAASRSR